MTNRAFIFDSYAFQDSTGELCLRYRYDNGPAFEEKIVFPPTTRPLTSNEKTALDNAFRLIFLLAGVSYYKAYIPERLICRAFPLDQATAAFIQKVYRHGLAEFAYQNKIDLTNRLNFQGKTENGSAGFRPRDLSCTKIAGVEPRAIAQRLLVPIGGGKDSIVTLECLKQANQNITLFALGGPSGPAEPIRKTIETSGLPSTHVARTLSPNLMELNRAGVLNGHVPITAILSSIAIACAILHGFTTIVMSNEHSASAPNIRIDNLDINHQYSKSFAFEKDLARYVRNHISLNINYFSLLRPLTETAIVERFAKLEKYHTVFRSCNTAFRQDVATRSNNWCCACPKCRFIFLALAPFMDKEKLIAIFGQNLLADAAQTEGFAELCGLGAHKPFECVGEIEECILLMIELTRDNIWKEDAVVHTLAPKLPARIKALDTLLDFHPSPLVPKLFLEML